MLLLYHLVTDKETVIYDFPVGLRGAAHSTVLLYSKFPRAWPTDAGASHGPPRDGSYQIMLTAPITRGVRLAAIRRLGIFKIPVKHGPGCNWTNKENGAYCIQ